MKKAILVLISAFVAAVAVQAQTFPHGQELPQLTKPEASEWKNIGFQAIWGDIFTRYPATYSPAGIKTNSSLTLRGWRGERVQAQALVSTGRKVEGLEYVVSDLKGRKGTIPSSAIEAGFVRYVMVDELNKDGKSGCSRRPDRTQYDSSMVADVIDPCFAPLDMEPMSSRGLWLTCWIPRGIPTGKYSGTVTFKENGKVLKVLKRPRRISFRSRRTGDSISISGRILSPCPGITACRSGRRSISKRCVR